MTKLFVDIFEKQHFMKEEKISRTMWFGSLTGFDNSNRISDLKTLLNQEITGLIT